MLTRVELTNSPRNTVSPSWDYILNYYTRAIDSTVFGEWGKVGGSSYSGSKWTENYYWTSHAWTDSRQFFVHSNSGRVIKNGTSNTRPVACRG